MGERGASKPPRWKRALALFAACSLLMGQGQRELAAQQKANEYQVKAAYLYNFGKFVTWPAGSMEAGFQICILGQDPFGAALDATVAGDSINGKPIVVRRIAAAREARGCDILFISASEEARVGEIMAALAGLHELTVSDMPHFVEHGGEIQFVLEGDKVRFEVNLAAAQQAGLTMSSQLLKVALTVKRSAEGGTR